MTKKVNKSNPDGTEEVSAKNKKFKRIFNISLIAVEALILVAALLLTVAILTSQMKEDTTLAKDPFFKMSFMPVLSPSMDPTFKEGDLIIVKEIKNLSELKPGDIISFWFYKDGNREINTHRIIEVTESGFITQGDNREICPESEVVDAKNVLAVYKGRIPAVGGVVEAIKIPVVFFFVVILPLIILFAYNAFLIIRLIIRYRVQRAAVTAAPSPELTEELKRKAIEEYLLSQAQNGSDEKEENSAATDKSTTDKEE